MEKSRIRYGLKMMLFSIRMALGPLVSKVSRQVDHTDFSDKWIIRGYPYVHVAAFKGFQSIK